MAKVSKKIALLGILAFFSLGGFAADKQIADPSRPTGLKPIDAVQMKHIKQNWPRVKKVHLNKLGLERINAVKAKRGKTLLDPSTVRPVGHELESAVEKSGVSVQAIALDAEILADLPTIVDNSELQYFPPIRDQGWLNSCAPFATTYTQFSYMTAFQKGSDITNDSDNTNKYSPKWTYNMVNRGIDTGSYIEDNYALLENHGAATWAEFPYDGVDFRAWCLIPATWRSAINTRTRTTQYVDAVNTENGMAQIKELLNDGYIVVFGTFIYSWQGQFIMDDPATSDDDGEVGKGVGYFVNGEGGSHAMTIVGYNDAIWTDVNGNAVLDPGEKGAFKIANSWGAQWQDGGFIWLAYDALRTVSDLPDGPSEGRHTAVQGNRVFVMTARDDYSPSMIAEFTVNHAKREQMWLTLGCSGTSETTPTIFWYPTALSFKGGPYAFDGSTTAIDGTFVLDFTDLLSETGVERKYYLGIGDNAEGDIAYLNAYKIIDVTTSNEASSITGLPIWADGSQDPSYAYTQYTYGGATVNHAPVLSYLPVGPAAGTVSDSYFFQVFYSDQDGDSAAIKSIYVDGIQHDMTESVTSPGWFYFSSQLSVGIHNYRFYFTDSRGESVSAPVSGSYSGPLVTLAHFVTLPAAPTGESMLVSGTSYEYATLGSTCFGTSHDIQYRFDWGDTTVSDWLPVGQTSAQHSWSSSGSYAVRAQARCVVETSIESSWSEQLIVTVPAGIPFNESFASSGFPQGWTQQNVGEESYNSWILTASTEAGGQPYEMLCEFEDVFPGTTRLVTAPINTTGFTTLRLQFKHFIKTWDGGGAQFKIQTSTDKVSWTDEAWSITIGSSDIGPATVDTVLTNNLNYETTYVAFVITGDLYLFDYWYIDDVSIIAPSKLRLFVKSTADTSIWLNTMLGDETYEGWQIMTPGGTTTTPALGVFNNVLHLIVKDSVDNKMWYRGMNSTDTWGDWSLLYGLSPSTASMAVFNNKLYLVVRGSDDRIYYRSMDTSGVWGGWTVLSVGATTTTPVVASFNGKLHLVVKSSVDTSIWWNSMDTTGAWAGWQQLYGLTPDPVAMVEFNNRLYMFVRGTDNNIYYRYLNTEGTWGSWTAMYGKTTISPTVAAFNGKLYLIVKSSVDSTNWMRSMDTEETWGNWSIMPGLTTIPVAVAII